MRISPMSWNLIAFFSLGSPEVVILVHSPYLLDFQCFPDVAGSAILKHDTL